MFGALADVPELQSQVVGNRTDYHPIFCLRVERTLPQELLRSQTSLVMVGNKDMVYMVDALHTRHYTCGMSGSMCTEQ